MPHPREPFTDTPLIRFLRTRGVKDTRVLDAMGRVSRAKFLPPREQRHALEDKAIAIGCDQTISQPFIVAVMSIELALTGVERVLEIGTGSGYQTAILAQLAAEVYTIERHQTLSLRARGVLDGICFTNIHYRVGDGTLGWPDAAPFDRVIITAAGPKVPMTVFGQLVEGGHLVMPLGDANMQHLTVVRKRDGKPVLQTGLACRFVPLIGEEGCDAPD